MKQRPHFEKWLLYNINTKYRKLTYIFRNNLIVPHCLDGQQNEDERGVDCGGSCKPCQGMNFDNAYRVLKCVAGLINC